MNNARILKNLLVGLLGCFTLPLTAHAITIDGGASPESVFRYGSDVFVSNVGSKLEPTTKDGDGFIGRIQLGNTLQKDIFAGNVPLNAPKGMGVYKDVLYVADIDRIVGIDLAAQRQVYEYSFIGYRVGFLNDVVIADSGLLYVSATDTGAIYSIDLKKGDVHPNIIKLPLTQLPGPNGLCLDAAQQRLFIGSFGVDKIPGELGVVDLSNNSYITVPGVHGMFDGIGLLDEKTLLVSDWVKLEKGAGVLKSVDIASGKVTILRQGLSGPADFLILNEHEYALPNMMNGSVLIEKLNR